MTQRTTARPRRAAATASSLFLSLSAALLLALWPSACAHAQAGAAPPVIRKSADALAAIRDNHVGIVTGTPGGVYAQLGNDLRRLFDDRQTNQLRLSAIIGAGSVANLDDLRNLPGVSLAILQGDVLEAYAADRDQFRWLEGSIRYVGRLHTEVLHVITRRDVIAAGGDTVCALAGRRVNIGGVGSGTSITVQKVLNGILGLNATLDTASSEEGLEKLLRRQVDAVAFVVGKPAPLFANDRLARRFGEDGFEWLAVPRGVLERGCAGGRAPIVTREQTVYEDAVISADDYPQLVAADQRIASIGVPAVLAAYRFDDPASARARATTRFVTRLFERAADPRDGLGRPEAGFNKNWCGVDLAAPVRVWRRHEAAAAWLDANQNARPQHPTRIGCAAARPAFCASPATINAEFSKRWADQGGTVAPADPGYMRAYDEFVRRECA